MEIEKKKIGSVKQMPVTKVNGGGTADFLDIISIEEPLEIKIDYGPQQTRVQKNISVTMRTPGNDLELALGFLFTEGIISTYDCVKDVYHPDTTCASQKGNVVQVEFHDDFLPHLMQSDRNFYTTSSCGVCGKAAIQSIRTISSFRDRKKPDLTITRHILHQLPAKLRREQSDFAATGGIHASGLFTLEADLVSLREDVGRHNALDKLVGSALVSNLLPLQAHILVLSGRASFELIQKAAMAGVSIVAAIGAPSSLAVDLARELDITLFGFLREDRFNIYYLSEYLSIAG